MLCCLFIFMVENADDDSVETKSSFVGYSGELKPPKVEVSVDVKPNIDEASFHVEVSHVNSCVSELGVNEFDTTHFFSIEYTWKDIGEYLI
jgi:hypothetical protein